MLSVSQQKFLTALQVKKYRQKYRKFTVEGSKMVAELLDQNRVTVAGIYGLERWAEENAALVAPYASVFYPLTEAELRKISSLSTPNAVLAVAEMPEPFPPTGAGWAFYLDGIRDPGNLGTILRVADWFGMKAVYCSPDCAEAYSPKVVQASMGAILRVSAVETELETLVAAQPGIPVFGAVLGGENVFDANFPARGLLVIGNESTGIRPEVETMLSQRLTIPRGAGSGAESLNAAVAAGIMAALALRSGERRVKK